ncbi:MAG: redoxin domain-containing protein [Acidobacteria bacterium]|nr:redoxin domain-containing protein [Acidobacteriota bacterium]MYD69729.1 redoxin domain-containing protein [Acidobacteriota bacterium]MYJ03604.1 redoxin domain-containing protein [Acidobacteriota bacterium]
MLQLQQKEHLLRELRIRVCIVTFEGEAAARAYAAETGTPWPVLSDRDKGLYEAYGMGRLSWRQLAQPSAIALYLGEILKGKLPQQPEADPHQAGGDVLIDPAGIVRLVHANSGSADRPTVQRLLNARRAAEPAPHRESP